MSDVERFEREYGCAPEVYADKVRRHSWDADPLDILETLDSSPQRIHDSDGYEEERLREIRESFDPWWKDPVRIARLWRWLDLVDRLPLDPALFIEGAASWQDEYDLMRAAEKR